ncbi:hypothetical protein CPC08DRAFT_767776 [Agrocybe pediades]|nr:hypothetical protein CPC08DRAFT_767776 [Agrocybe pediades]
MPIFTKSEFQILESLMKKTSDADLRDFKMMALGLPPDLMDHSFFALNNLRRWAFGFDHYVRYTQALRSQSSERPSFVPPEVASAYQGPPLPRALVVSQNAEIEEHGGEKRKRDEDDTPSGRTKLYVAGIAGVYNTRAYMRSVTRPSDSSASTAASAPPSLPTATPTPPLAQGCSSSVEESQADSAPTSSVSTAGPPRVNRAEVVLPRPSLVTVLRERFRREREAQEALCSEEGTSRPAESQDRREEAEVVVAVTRQASEEPDTIVAASGQETVSAPAKLRKAPSVSAPAAARKARKVSAPAAARKTSKVSAPAAAAAEGYMMRIYPGDTVTVDLT